MIQAKDLRVGNWLLYDEDGKWTNQQVQYVAAGLQGYNGYYVSFGWATTTLQADISNFDDWELYVKGIPLTPEILEKCGFEKYTITAGVGINEDIECYRLADMSVFFDISGRLVLKDYHSNMNRLQYLHQLQNLTHALTQTELQIQL